MTDPTTASRVERARVWVRDHQRAAGLIALTAAFALVALAAYIGINVFSAPLQVGQPDPTASASPPSGSPAPSSQPSRSPAPSVEPTDTEASPSGPIAWPPQPDGGTFFFEGIWGVSVVDDLNVRSGPGTEHPAIGQLDESDLFVALASPVAGTSSSAWLEIAIDGGVVGYVTPGPSDDPYLLSTPIPWHAWSSSLTGVASNGSSYLAFGTTYAHDYPQWEGGAGPLLLASDDGVSWTSVGEGLGSIRDVAGGAEGWVALTNVYPGVALTSFSADGRTWEESQFHGGSSVAYGRAGWVAMAGSDAMHSSDGRTWSDPFPTTLTAGSEPDIEGSDSGYVAWNPYGGELTASVDGDGWQSVTLPLEPDDWVADVELAGSRLFVLATDSGTGGSWLHRGTLATNATVTWDAPPAAIGAEGLHVNSISNGAEGLLALGWDIDELLPVVWASRDGDVWERVDTVPAALGGSIGPEPAWGSAGWVGIGSAVGSIGQQLWSSARGDAWAPVGPEVAYAPDALPCAPIAEVSVLTLAYMGRLAEECYGNASFTVRAWVPLIEGLGGCCWPDPSPEWLARPISGAWLAPGPTDQMRATVPIYLPPGVDAGPLATHTWVEVTGHFRDPASDDCRQTPRPDYAQRLGSLQSAQLACRQRLVVERIVAVDGP